MGATRRPQLRDAVRRQDRTRRRASARPAGCSTSSPAKWPTGSWKRSSTGSSTCGCRSPPAAPRCSPPCCPRSLSEGFARAIKADRVLAGADFDSRRNYELRASRSEPGPRGPAAAAAARGAPPPRTGRIASLPAAGRYEAAVELEAEAGQPGPEGPAGRSSSRPSAAARARAARAGSGSPRRYRPVSHSAIRLADQRALVLLQEVARVLDRPRALAADRLGEALAGAERDHRVGVGPQHQRRAAVVAQRLEHPLPGLGAGRVGGRGEHQRERPRAGLRGGVRIGGFVGGDHLVAGIGLAGAPHEHAHGQVLGALRRSRGTRSRRRSSSGGR